MITKFFSTLLYKPVRLIGVLALIAIFGSSCQAAAVPVMPAATAPSVKQPAAPAVTSVPSVTAPAAAPEPTINVASNSELGSFLAGDNGMTLYMFTKDGPDKSNCNADCLKKWPPLLTQGKPALGKGVDPALVGAATLPDGSKIVTYNKMPLYYWVKDVKAGDTTGQGVGSVWYVVSPDGKVVDKDEKPQAAAPTAAAPAVTAAPAAADEPAINVASNAELGSFLVGDNGMTLYMFTKDEPGKSNCNPDCLKKWPPVLTHGSPKLGAGVDPALVGTATLPDGSKIVTYNKMPLYYWVKDVKAGDTTGQGVGDVWYVVAPDGKVVDHDVAPQAAAPTAAAPSAAAPAAAVAEPTISIVKDPVLGSILVGDNGMTLYMFTKDGPGKSTCNADCLKKWPPLLTHGSPKLGPGVDAALVGTATLPDGSMIVTYNKMPLYYWVKDVKAGDTTGQGVGSVWYVVSPSGQIVKGPVSSAVSEPTPAPGIGTYSGDNSKGHDKSDDNSKDKGPDY